MKAFLNWVREAAATQPVSYPGAKMERVGFWMALLLLFVPVFYFLLFFRPYSLSARLGWGAWVGLIVFVKVMGFAEPVLKITPPSAEGGPALVREDVEIPLAQYVSRLLGSQYMDHYLLEGDTVTIVYEPKPSYFDSEQVLADLAISNGYSLMFRRDLKAVNLDLQHNGQWLRLAMTRAAFLKFFRVSEADILTYADTKLLQASPIYDVSKENKAEFVRVFSRAPPSVPKLTEAPTAQPPRPERPQVRSLPH